METVIVNQNQLSSILLGYTQNTGWRGQGGILAIQVPYSEWKAFNSSGVNRVNLNGLDEKSYLLDIAASQYNELLYSWKDNNSATIITPYSHDQEMVTLDDVNAVYSTISDKALSVSEYKIMNCLNQYYTRIDQAAKLVRRMNEDNLSEWNKQILHLSLIYPLLTDVITIEWR
jgi:hypothetical protein